MQLTVDPVHSKAERAMFIRMPWRIYRDDPHWVPPLLSDRRKVLDPRRNPFFQHAKMELFLARLGGEVVGRVAAIVNDAHNTTHNDKVGFFGFFETIDDQAVANALLGAAEAWLVAQGMTEMRGPISPSMNDEAGLLVEGFDDPPVVLMPYNPKYYSRVIEVYGLAPVKDLVAWRLTPQGFLTEKLERVQRLVREREGITIRSVNFKDRTAFQRDLDRIKGIYNAAWQPNWGFVKMTDAEFDALAADLRQVAVPDFTVFAERNGEAVGFALALPDLNQILIHNRGGGLLGAAWGMLTRRKRVTRGRIVILGVLPEFQRRGVDAVLYYEIGTRMTRGAGYTESEASWVLEDNVMMNRALEEMNGEPYKRYRVYEKTMKKN